MSDTPDGFDTVTTPAWLAAAVDQRVAWLVETFAGLPPAFPVVMIALTDPPDNHTDEQYAEWDKSCDQCGRPAVTYGAVQRRHGDVLISITYGACTEHKGERVE